MIADLRLRVGRQYGRSVITDQYFTSPIKIGLPVNHDDHLQNSWFESDTVACVKGDRIDRIGTPEEIFTGDYIQKMYGVDEMSFDPVTGQVFLHAEKKAPEAFVIGGGGSGIAVYQKLHRKQIPFAAGILQENDVEFAAAIPASAR